MLITKKMKASAYESGFEYGKVSKKMCPSSPDGEVCPEEWYKGFEDGKKSVSIVAKSYKPGGEGHDFLLVKGEWIRMEINQKEGVSAWVEDRSSFCSNRYEYPAR